jgi:molecular chaperone HscB
MDTFDPFAVLGLPRRYGVGAAEVQRAYLARAAGVHPDLAGDEDEVEERSALLNRARETLESPERRAVALWRLLGGGGREGEDDRALPPGFLMEMMEVREELEAAQRTRDPEGLRKWEAWAAERRKGHEAAVARLFEGVEGVEGGAGAADPGVLKKIKLELNAWRYVERLIEQLEPG